jgi:hypothetical protein
LVLGAVDALVVSQIGHVPVRGDLSLRLDVQQRQRHGRLKQRAHGPQGGAVGEHHDGDAVDPAPQQLLGGALDVLPIAGGRREDHLTGLAQALRHVGGVLRLVVSDPGDHLVV